MRTALPVACLAALSLCSCAGVSAVPAKPGAGAKSTNVWPLYKSVADEKTGLQETQVLWPFFKSKSAGDESMTRFWPLFYFRSGEGSAEDLSLESGLSSLCVISNFSAPKKNVTGILHPTLINFASEPKAEGRPLGRNGFSIVPYTALPFPTIGWIGWDKRDMLFFFLPVYYKSVDVNEKAK